MTETKNAARERGASEIDQLGGSINLNNTEPRLAPQAVRRCATCFHFDLDHPAACRGICTRRPPRMIATDRGQWPRVVTDGRCGEWRARRP